MTVVRERRSVRLEFRCTEHEKLLYRAVALLVGMTMSEWLRTRLVAMAEVEAEIRGSCEAMIGDSDG